MQYKEIIFPTYQYNPPYRYNLSLNELKAINKQIEELECEDVDDEEMKGYLIQRTDTFKEILSKYKEIIGSNDEN